MERIFDTGSTAVLAGISLLGFAHLGLGSGSEDLLTKARAAGVLLLGGFAAAVCFLIYFRLHGAEWMKKRFAHWHEHTGWRAKVAGMLEGLSQGLQSIRTPGDLFAVVGFSIAHWVLVVMVYQWVAHSFGGKLTEIDFPAAMLVLVFSMVGSMIQLPAVGGGSQVACFVAFTRLFGVETELAAATSITLWLVTFASCVLAGIPLLIHEGFSMGELRGMAKAEKEAERHGEHLQEIPPLKREGNENR
jgi:lysylphosphatidylglycerol synthase-like protein